MEDEEEATRLDESIGPLDETCDAHCEEHKTEKRKTASKRKRDAETNHLDQAIAENPVIAAF